MAEKLEIYKCELCGNLVELLHGGKGDLTCCNEAMKLYKENTVDAAKEKHVPVVEEIQGGYKVKVGDVPHPMQEKHYIEFVEIIAGGKVYRQSLNSEENPEASFMIDKGNVVARAYCNLHGLWKG